MHGECNGCSLQMDEVLASVAEKVKNFAVIYVVDITEVPDFNTMYELYDPSTVMFFFRNKHIMIDLGTKSIGHSRTSKSSSTSSKPYTAEQERIAVS
ncbi:hypothetical protein V6Z11_A01G016100 [Gossypium hirsutum]